MPYWDAVYSFMVALAVSAAATPLAARLARRGRAVDVPRDRGPARKETPLLGGLAILLAVLVSGAIWLNPDLRLPHVAHGLPGSGGTVHIWWVIGGACLI